MDNMFSSVIMTFEHCKRVFVAFLGHSNNIQISESVQVVPLFVMLYNAGLGRCKGHTCDLSVVRCCSLLESLLSMP